MARFSKLQVLGTIASTGMVPVFYHSDQETARKVLSACYRGGVRAFEFTNRGDFAHEIFSSLVKYAREECPDMILGAGTVVDAGTASLYMQCGADFIVGPLFNGDVARTCNRRQVPYIPGCGSVSEIGMAQEYGCDICKIFPAGNVGGPSFVKNVLAPMPWTRILATGAVSPDRDNLSAWIKAGVTAVGMGSKLFPPDVIQAGQWDIISELCSRSLAIIAESR